MRRVVLGLAFVIGAVAPVAADERLPCDAIGCDGEPLPRRPQIVADLGLSVIQAGYEHPFGEHWAVAATAGLFGSYFLPWFDRGDKVIGIGGGLRATYTFSRYGRGFYIAPYFRAHRVSGDHDGMDGTGLGFSAGAFAGYSFPLGDWGDLRTGAGAQYIHHHLDTPAGKVTTSTPFLALDLLVGIRL